MLATDCRHHHGAFPAVFDCPEAVPLDVAEGGARRSSLSESVGSARPAIVTSVSLRWCALSKPSFFVVITTFCETVWTQLTVLILDYLVP